MGNFNQSVNKLGFFQENTPLPLIHKKTKKWAEESNLFVLRSFVALALPLAVMEASGPSAFFEQLDLIMGIAGPALFLLFAFMELIKWGGLLYRLYDKETRANEWQKLKNTGFIGLYQPVISALGIAFFVATLLAPPVGLLLPGIILILTGAGLSAVRHLIKMIRYQNMKNYEDKAQQNAIKMVVSALLTVAFAFFLFPVGIPLVSSLAALTMVYALAVLVPSFITLWQGGKADFFTANNAVHMVNILIAFAGIALTIATLVMPPLAIAGLAVLGGSVLFSTTLSVYAAKKKLADPAGKAEVVKNGHTYRSVNDDDSDTQERRDQDSVMSNDGCCRIM